MTDWIKCPHCKGKTTCDCSTCGFFEEKRQISHQGICKVCQGRGEIKVDDS